MVDLAAAAPEATQVPSILSHPLVNVDDAGSVAESDVFEEEDNVPVPAPAPTGELTLAAIWSPGLTWRRRAMLITAALAVNIGLPFINGIMLGFGEIFARAFLAPILGLAPPLQRYSLHSPSPANVPPLDSIPPGGLRGLARSSF
ncbi:hypothetical protein MCUN1_000633 [Malassezia cuniculi]|uniref:Mitochondrial import protein 1 n=1 Tax=Malassezia cuniculi TaxID=948313 RepID=A0AAF0ENF1_9BASI|nr:hypothetical protein MCUN1_000633 [Malassezia cuniculi]